MSLPAEAEKPLWSQTATELASLYRVGAATPTAALEAVLERIEDVNPRINAVVTLDVAGAREAAAAASQRWRNGTPLGPLDGVPLTVKDNLFVRGLRATWGSLLYAEHVAPQDDLPVARLRAAGAVIFGKTNTPELALAGYTDNRLFGSTGNPWAPNAHAGRFERRRGRWRQRRLRPARRCDGRRGIDPPSIRTYRAWRASSLGLAGCRAVTAFRRWRRICR